MSLSLKTKPLQSSVKAIVARCNIELSWLRLLSPLQRIPPYRLIKPLFSACRLFQLSQALKVQKSDNQVPSQQSPGQDGNLGPWRCHSSREKGLCCRGRSKVEKGAPSSPAGNRVGWRALRSRFAKLDPIKKKKKKGKAQALRVFACTVRHTE